MELEIAHLDRKYEGLRIEDRAQLGRLMSSLLEHGQKTPVLVVATRGASELERSVLIDGYRRVRALDRLGRDVVLAARLEVAEPDALVLCQKLDGRRRLSALEEGWFLRELVEGHGLRPAELALRLERSPSWVSRRLALVKVLPAAVQEAVRRGRLWPQVARKVMVLLARANPAACERLVGKLGGEPWSVRQMERLYRAWRGATPETRDRIVEHPELYRRVEEELGENEKSPAARIARDLGVAYGVSVRIRSRLEEGALDTLDEPGRRRLARSFRRAREAFADVSEGMEDKLALPRHANRDSPAPEERSRDPHHRQGAGDLAKRSTPGAS